MAVRAPAPSDPPGHDPALEALRAAVAGTARASGERFFPALCQALCRALDVPHALLGELSADGLRSEVRAVCWGGEPGKPFVYDLTGTPCERVLGAGESAFIPRGVAAAFPLDRALAARGIEAYIGVPLVDHAERKVGILVVMSDRPIDPARAPLALVEIFAARAAGELERLRLEQQLVRSQRLEAMGRLAASVAHDFNNLLTVIRSNAEFAHADLPPGSPVRELIAPIDDAARRATSLTRQLLAFSRRQPTAPVVLDLRAEAAGPLRLVERLLDRGTTLDARLDATWPVRIDPAQLEQLVVNLAVNARDAVAGRGTITVRAEDARIDAPLAAAHGVAAGDYVLLSVADDGAGMDEETRARCFEPFFSTKGERGTGLGLATCSAIARQARGAIWVESERGRGTAVRVLLPRHAGPVDAEARRAPPSAPAPAARGETVLVAEDDPAVRRVARRTLEQAGYRVVVAADGAEALRVIEAGRERVDALLADVAMPGMTGPELSAAARAVRPGLPVLFASGYADEATVATLERAGDPLVLKPYTPEELRQRVRELLDR